MNAIEIYSTITATDALSQGFDTIVLWPWSRDRGDIIENVIIIVLKSNNMIVIVCSSNSS